MYAVPLLLLACSNPGTGPSSDGRGGRDSAGDTAGGDDTADSVDTGDTPPGDPLCSDRLPDGAPEGPDCVTSAIACGDTVEATLAGGRADWTGADYTHDFCFPNLENHGYDGPERVYALELPADTVATVSLDAPCADVDLAALRWEDADTCPVSDAAGATCEGSDAAGDDTVSFSWDAPTRWLLIVDAKYADDGAANFRIRVSCAPA